MKNKFLSKSVPRGTRTIWRYLSALFILFTFAIGNVWAESVTFTATDMSGKTSGVKKESHITALCPTSESDQQAYKTGSAVKHKAISLGSSADTAVIVPASGKSLHFRADAGYKITGISIFAAANKDSICGEPIVMWTGAISKKPAFVGNIEAPSRAGTSDPDPIVVTNIPDGTTAFALYRRIKYNSTTGEIGSGSNFGRSQQTWNIFSVTITYEATGSDPVCPETLTISSKDSKTAFTEGDAIELTAALAKGNGDISYQWYKGSVAPANAISGATKAKYEVASCTTADAGDYFCVASKATCSDAVNASAFAITVAAAPVIEPTGDATITYALSGATTTGTVSGVSSISSLSTALAASTLTIGDAKSGYSGAISGCSSETELQENDYVDVQFTVASGYVFTPSAVSVKVNPFNATGAVKAVVALQDAALDVRSEVLACAKSTDNAVVFADGAFTEKEFEGTVHVRIYFYGPASSKAFYIKSPIEITGAVAVAPTKYDLEFAANGGEGTMSTLKYKSGVEVTLPACTFDAPSASQEFDAWVVTKKVGGASVTVTDGKFTMPTEAVVATATWKTKDVKYTVTYKDGTTTIGTEKVIAGGHPAEYAAKQSRNLAAFVGWYSDADLADGHLISDIAAMTVSEDVTVYGKWTYTYAQSVNVEKWVLDNGKTPNSDQTGALISLLGTRGFASNLAYEEGKLELDSLNDSKGTGRNYTYLGLKVKLAGKMLDFRLAKNSTVKVKFGNVGTTPLYAINGGEYSDMPIEEKVFTYIATGNDYISIKMADNDAVVFKQIMIDAEIQDVTLPEPTRHAVELSEAGETEHGTLAVASPEEYNWLAEGAAVTLSVAVDDGYYIESVKLNGDALTPSENVYSFAMPNATANVVATFAEIVPNSVTYMPNGATTSVEYIVDDDATVVLGCPAQFIAPASTVFAGWNTDPDGNGDAYAAGDPVLSPLQLYAQWRSYFTITYMDGETELDTENVFEGDAPVGIADPVKAMNIFQGWTLAGSDEVIDVTTLTASTTVYAKWEAIDACFYFEAKSVTESEAISAEDEINTTYGGTLVAKTANISYETQGVLVASSGNTYVTANLDYAMTVDTKITVVLAAAGTGSRGVNLCVAGQKSSIVEEMSWDASVSGEEKEFTYTLDANSALKDKKTFSLFRTGNAYIKSIIVKDCAPQDYTVTYKDGENVLGTEQVYENAHPTAVGIATYKQGYVFQGWKETVDGAVVDLNNITITAAKDLYAEYTVIDCSGVGSKYQFQFKTDLTSGNLPVSNHADMSEYVDQSAGGAVFFTSSSAGQGKIVGDTAIQFTNTAAYLKVELGCALAAGDRIRIRAYGNPIRVQVGTSYDSDKDLQIVKNDFEWKEITSAMEGVDDLYITRASNGNATLTYFEVYRPAKYNVSFNMMDHGTQIADIEDVLEGSKITAPTAPEDADYAFAGWYKENTLENEWDFANDVVVANTTLYAKWLDKSDATLKSLKYGTTDIQLQAGIYEYNIELSALTAAVPALTAVANSPLATPAVDDADAFDGEGHATSTVTVTPAVGAAQVYTVNFSKAAALPQVNVTEATTWDWSLAGSTSLENISNAVLANVPGITNDNTFNSQALLGTFNKLPGNYFQGSMLTFTTEVAGRLIIEFCGTNNNARKLNVYDAADNEIASWDYNSGTHQTKSVFVPAGKVTLKAFQDDAAQNVRIYNMELSTTPDYHRENLNPNNIGTLCWTNNAVLVNATLYELVGKNEVSKLVFDEVDGNKIVAGSPYIFVPENGNTEIKVFNTDDAEPMANADLTPVNGMMGTFVDLSSEDGDGTTLWGNYIISNNKYIYVDYTNCRLGAYRAYVLPLEEVPAAPAEPQPGQNGAPRRRLVMDGNQAPAVTTGMDNLNAGEQPIKVMIDGQIFIIRGEQMYDATGRLVK